MRTIVPLTYSEIEERHPNETEVIELMSRLNRKRAFLFLTMINTLICLYERDDTTLRKVQSAFFNSLTDEELFRKIRIKFWSDDMATRPLFFRKQILTLMKYCLEYSPEEGGFDLSDGQKGRHDLGIAALMMSDLVETEADRQALDFSTDDPQDVQRAREVFSAQMMPSMELENHPEIIASFVRNNEYFQILKGYAEEGKPLFSNGADLNQKFQELAGINLDDFLQLTTITCLYYLKTVGAKKPEDIINDPSMLNVRIDEIFSKMDYSQDTVNAFFRQTTASIEEIVDELKKHKATIQLPEHYDFTVFRRYPLVFTRESRDIATCLDASFLAEKTANGVYFTIHNALKENATNSRDAEKDHKKFMGLWGNAFEDYVNDRIKDGRHSIDFREYYLSTYFTDPPTKGKSDYSAFDAVIDMKSSLIVMEHKGKFASLPIRYSGERDILLNELKRIDLVGGAISQIATNLGYMFNTDVNAKRHTISAKENGREKTYQLREINRVSRIYPVIVHQDYILRLSGANIIARQMFEEEVLKQSISHKIVRPLTLLTVEDLEALIPYLKIKALPFILESYFRSAIFYDTFSNFWIRFKRKHHISHRKNEWMKKKSEELLDAMGKRFTTIT